MGGKQVEDIARLRAIADKVAEYLGIAPAHKHGYDGYDGWSQWIAFTDHLYLNLEPATGKVWLSRHFIDLDMIGNIRDMDNTDTVAREIAWKLEIHGFSASSQRSRNSG